MLYFSPLSVTDDKQRDRNHPFSFPQCRQGGQNGGGCVRGSQSGFPLLNPTMQAGQDSDGGVGGTEEMCTLHAVVVLCFGC